MDNAELIQRLREARLATLALADQVDEERWRTPLLPGENSLHGVLSHLLGWDEWAAAVFDINGVRPLPPALVDALKDVDAYNARAVKRYSGLSRDDLLTGLQSSGDRMISSAIGRHGEEWSRRRIPELAGAEAINAAGTEAAQRGPSARGILRVLLEHERGHAGEVEGALGITADLDRFKPPLQVAESDDQS